MLLASALMFICLQGVVAATNAPLPEMTPANDLAISVSSNLIDWDACIVFGDGQEVGKAPQETLLRLVGLPSTSPQNPATWSSGPLAGEIRHFRIAFLQPIQVGTLCIMAGDTPALSYLKDDSRYPGDVTCETDWEPVSGGAVKTLPSKTLLRALRFTYQTSNMPWENGRRTSSMSAVLILKGRFWSPASLGSGSSWSIAGPQNATFDRWTGSWPRPLPISGLAVLDLPSGEISVQALPGTVVEHAMQAESDKWNPVTATSMYGAGPAVIALDAKIAAKGLQMDVHGPRKDRKASTAMPLVALRDGEKTPNSFIPDPPLTFAYDMPMDGFMAIRIADEKNRDVRRLIAEVERPKGSVRESWDLKDENGKYVTPGKYAWFGLVRPPLKLTYEMTVYNAGHPPWLAPVPGNGWWMADHCPPRAVCTVKDQMFFGAQGAEFGIPFIATDLDGKKLWHFNQGVERLTSDGQFAYVVNDDAIIRFDPSDRSRTEILRFPYSDDIPNRIQTWIQAEVSGAACGNGLMAVSYNAPEPAWITSSIKAHEVDLKACVPAVTYEKVHETDYTPAERIFGTFLMVQSSLQARLGPAAGNGATAHTVVLALRKEVPIGSVMIPNNNMQVWALRPGKPLPNDFKNTAPSGPDTDLFSDNLDDGFGMLSLDAEGDGRFPEEDWILLKTGDAGSSNIALTPKNGVKTRYLVFSSKSLGTLDCAMVLDRRYRNAAPEATLKLLEGNKAGVGGWNTTRDANRPLSTGNPAIAAFVWPKTVPIRGFALLHPMARAGVAFDLWTGSENDVIDSEAMKDDANWKHVYSYSQNEHDIKMGWHANSVIHFDLGETKPVRALRIRLVTMPTRGSPFSGGFQSLVAFQPLGDDPELPARLTQRVTLVELPTQKSPARISNYLSLPKPGPLTFDKEGSLYVACTQGIVRIRDVALQTNPPLYETVIPASAIQKPRALNFGPDGMLYVLNGAINAVQVFDLKSAQQVRTIGTPGGTQLGPWDPTRLTEPVAMTIDASNKLWIVDSSFQPKRISRWSLDGQYEKDFMGPTHYGSGGFVDPGDHTVVSHLGMKFRMDFTNRTWRMESILHGYETRGMYLPDRPLYYKENRYLIGDRREVIPFGGGGPIATICEEKAGVAVPVVATGLLNGWTSFGGNAEVLKLYSKRDFAQTSFLWTDLNRDSQAQSNEVQLLSGPAFQSMAGIGDDLSLNFTGYRVRLKALRADGLPLYDIRDVESVPELTGQCLVTTNGETFVMGHKFLDRSGKVGWSYPDPYGSVQASYQTPWGFTERPAGKLCGGMWPCGYFKAGGEDLFCVNGNNGDYYAFTRDGLLAAAIVGGPRGYGRRFFSMPECEPGKTDLSDLRKTIEQFGGWVTAAEDGNVYATIGKNHVTVIRVDGLEKMQRIEGTLDVTTADIQAAIRWSDEKAAIEQASRQVSIFTVPYLPKKPTIDGDILTDWPVRPSLEIHVTRDAKGEIVESWNASLAYDSDCLYLAARAVDISPLMNSATPDDLQRLFQFGDAFDLNLGLDPNADPGRQDPIPGDIRLVISMVAGKPVAMLYRYKVPGDAPNPVTFTSPVTEIVIDEIRELTDAKISLVRAGEREWKLEAAIPWKSLGGKAPSENATLRGDIGFLLSDPNGLRSFTRYYWANHSNVVMSDLPSEARILPGLWGEFIFEEFDMFKSIENMENDSLLDF